VIEHEPERQLDERERGLVGELRKLLDGIELALVVRVGEVKALGKPAGARGGLLPSVLAPAAGQPAAGERAVGDDGHVVALAGGQDVGLDRAYEDRVRRLLGDKALQVSVACGPLRLDDPAGRKRGLADRADLALVNEVGEGAERLLDIGAGVNAVDVAEVDPVGVQSPQRASMARMIQRRELPC
jgi:hypothetical protein